jgi:hypothetical protein
MLIFMEFDLTNRTPKKGKKYDDTQGRSEESRDGDGSLRGDDSIQ